MAKDRTQSKKKKRYDSKDERNEILMDKKEEVLERIWKVLLSEFPEQPVSTPLCLSCFRQVFNSWFCEECWPKYMEEWRRLIRRRKMLRKIMV